MSASMKVILTAVGIAVLASPVMAQTGSAETHRHARAHAVSSARIISGEAHGSVASQSEGAAFNQPFSQDCVHVAFPQCTGGN
jgi:hypothetical protein